MKLISLYIENFGGLHQYSLDFQEGLTVIQEPNGFGKTTLAEFIRAMFYGFPRKAKTLDKSRRQKYTPWQGGKFGGNLLFELDGTQYRIERTFGATPKGDSFNLIDLTTNKKSTRFSEEIGLELFQLDADSFERSTYLPQMQDLGSLSTDNIQAKLGNLVEDSNDVGNFDRAMNALKTARSGFIPYRGSGGSVAEAQAQVSRLQGELERTMAEEKDLEWEEQVISGLETQLQSCSQRKETLHHKMDAANAAAAVAAAHREKTRLTAEKQYRETELAQLNSRYPKGLPGEEQLTKARRAASELAVLRAQQVKHQEDADAETWLEENGTRFAAHLPTQEQLQDCRQQISDYLALQSELENTGLSVQEQGQYQKLLPLEKAGHLKEERLDALDEASRELTKKRHTLESIALSETEKGRMAELRRYFGAGMPSEEQLEQHRTELEKAAQLQLENGEWLEELAKGPAKRRSPWLMLAWLLAAAGIGGGIYLLTAQMTTAAYGILGFGVAALILAVSLLVSDVRKNRRQELALRELIQEAEEKLDGLEQSAAVFAEQYTATKPLTEALHEIRSNREDLLHLSDRAAVLRQKREQLCSEIGALEKDLRRALGSDDFDREILNLRLAAGQLRDLQRESAAAQERRRTLDTQIGALWEAIRSFLGLYFESVELGDLHSQLSQLQHSREKFVQARHRVAAWQQRERDHQQQTQLWETVLEEFFEAWDLVREEDVREQLLGIRDDLRDWEELSAELAESCRSEAEFQEKHRKELETPVPENQEDLSTLRLEEGRLREEMEELSEQLLHAKQQRGQILDRLSCIPALRDELEGWQEKRSADRKKVELLDKTMIFLEKARESLQNSYFGPVRESFRGYMQNLLGEREENILLAPDLEVQLERSGQARELGYFSAGQTDAVMLCMRLALVDALFKQVKPFVILDDPFVNLDDERTAQALGLLRELAKDRQIIYLVCNSSRKP